MFVTSTLLSGRDQGRDSEELRQGRRLLSDPQRRQHLAGPAHGCENNIFSNSGKLSLSKLPYSVYSCIFIIDVCFDVLMSCY